MAQRHEVWLKSTGCEFDLHSRRRNIYLNLYFHFFILVSRLSAALSSATKHAMPPEFGRKWGTECLNTRFPLPTLLCAGCSVKLIYMLYMCRGEWGSSSSVNRAILKRNFGRFFLSSGSTNLHTCHLSPLIYESQLLSYEKCLILSKILCIFK